MSNTIQNSDNFKIFYNSFINTAIWSSVDSEGEPLDAVFEDINEEGHCILKAHALSFYSRCWYYVEHEEGRGFEDLGHDFWLTSAGHGAGFCDGDWPKYGDMLTKISKCYELEFIDLMCFID